MGIIGFGYMGSTHAGIFAKDSRVEITSVFDVKPERNELAARNFGAKSCENAAQIFDTCDAVIITAPNKTHPQYAIAAANAGKHVLCEKPMATSLAEAKAILEAAANSKAVFQVGHNRRFAPVYVTLKEMIAADAPFAAHIKMNRGELQNPVWTGDKNITGGFLYETPIHLFDMMRFQFGEISELSALGSSKTYDEVDNFSLLVKFENGFHATFATSAAASWLFPFERIEVFGEHRSIVTQEMENLQDSKGVDANFQTLSWHQLAKEERWGYVQEDAAFVNAILDETEPPVTAYDGYKSVELVEAVYQSVKTGETIKFSS